MKLKENEIAPNFSLPDQDGAENYLDDYRGAWVLLYFYPQDDSPGCTVQASQIRDELHKFEELNVKVIGISPDSVASHRDFADKHSLPFTLLADENEEVIDLYGVRGNTGTNRASFLINPEGVIEKIYE